MLGLNVYEDTPVEILHTVSLGVVKYLWKFTTDALKGQGQDMKTFQTRLASLNEESLHIQKIRAAYIVEYKGALIGHQFKDLVQLVPFTLHNLTTIDIRDCWRRMGHFMALVWYPEIEDIDVYCDQLRQAINNLIDALCLLDPKQIILKSKIHTLLHLPDDIRRFGPAVSFSTELFEGFNGVFRLCSILSNRQAPSRDIAHKFGELDRVKHLLCAGWWSERNEWVSTGEKLAQYMRTNPFIQKHLGWAPRHPCLPGSVNMPSKRLRKNTIQWEDTGASTGEHVFGDVRGEGRNADEGNGSYISYPSCVAQLGDIVRQGSFVIAQKVSQLT